MEDWLRDLDKFERLFLFFVSDLCSIGVVWEIGAAKDWDWLEETGGSGAGGFWCLDILVDIFNGGEFDSIVEEELLEVDEDDDVADGDDDDGNEDGQIFKFFE